MSKLKKILDRIIEEQFKRIQEMPKIRDMQSGCIKSQSAKNAVKAARSGEPIELNNGKKFIAIKNIRGIDLKQGDIFMASYSSTNQGADVYKFLGITDDSTKYGDQFKKQGKVAYKSVKDCLIANNVKSLKELQALQDKNEYGFQSYLCVQDLDSNDKGAWFYLYKGRWSRGSGAEALSFTLLKPE